MTEFSHNAEFAVEAEVSPNAELLEVNQDYAFEDVVVEEDMIVSYYDWS